MQNQFMFINQGNNNINMNIMFYKQEIMKLIDEIIEIDLENYQKQLEQQQQTINPFLMSPIMNPNMMMPNMQVMSNQYIQQILEKKLELYKEKFEKLTEEKIERKKKLEQMKPMNPQVITDNKILLIKVMMEDGKKIFIQNKSKDKFEEIIRRFKSKIGDDCDYDFFIIKEKKTKKAIINLTLEENGINDDDCYIFARKKLNNGTENNIEEQYINYINEFKAENNSNESPQINTINSRNKINLIFRVTSGLNINITIDNNKTFKEAVTMFCNKLELSFPQVQQNITFIYNIEKLYIEDKRPLSQIALPNDLSEMTITCLDQGNVIAA